MTQLNYAQGVEVSRTHIKSFKQQIFLPDEVLAVIERNMVYVQALTHLPQSYRNGRLVVYQVWLDGTLTWEEVV